MSSQSLLEAAALEKLKKIVIQAVGNVFDASLNTETNTFNMGNIRRILKDVGIEDVKLFTDHVEFSIVSKMKPIGNNAKEMVSALQNTIIAENAHTAKAAGVDAVMQELIDGCIIQNGEGEPFFDLNQVSNLAFDAECRITFEKAAINIDFERGNGVIQGFKISSLDNVVAQAATNTMNFVKQFTC